MSLERRRFLKAYGAELELTPREKGMKGAIERAQELASQTPHAWIPQQFENEANIEVHRKTTAQEILQDFPEGFDMLISGVGTGGHITGCAEVLKKKFPKLKVFAVEPAASPVISGGKPGPHPLQGLGAGFIPKNLHTDLLDGLFNLQKKKLRIYPPLCARRRHFGRNFQRRRACCSCQENPGIAERRANSYILLRYGRAILVRRGFVSIKETI